MLKNRTFYYVVFALVIGFGCNFFLWHSENNAPFIAVLSPVLALSDLIPNQLSSWVNLPAEQNQLIFQIPFASILTFIYFGLMGYWVRQISRENGFLKYVLLIAFAIFLIIIHWQSLEYVHEILTSKPAGA